MTATPKNVLVTDFTWPSSDRESAVLAEVGARLVVAQTATEEEFLRLVGDADAILTCFARVSAAVIRAGRRLQVIGRYGIGVDNIAVDEATRLGLPVTNVPAYCVDEVAEHTLALLLACARGVCRYSAALRRGDWGLKTAMPLGRVRGRVLGIVGFGKIGRSLAAKAQGLGMRVLVHDHHATAEAVRQARAELLALDEVLRQADFLSLHVPATPQTRGLLNAERLRRMKPTAFIINTARGALIDQHALLDALRERRIAGAALDVFEPERLPPDHPLLALPNVLATPHVAFYSEESVAELQTRAARNVAAVLSGRLPESVVNPEVLRLPRWSQLR
jgi:D-3-phosphoglycerate dehydrogenase